jgi:hypothetical protein
MAVLDTGAREALREPGNLGDAHERTASRFGVATRNPMNTLSPIGIENNPRLFHVEPSAGHDAAIRSPLRTICSHAGAAPVPGHLKGLTARLGPVLE